MRRRKNQLYMKCVDGQFVLQGQAIGSVIDVQILEVNYWLLKWVDGKVVKRRKLKENCRWPKGYYLSAELKMVFAGCDCSLTVYTQNVLEALTPYVMNLAEQGITPNDVLTQINCSIVAERNQLAFRERYRL